MLGCVIRVWTVSALLLAFTPLQTRAEEPARAAQAPEPAAYRSLINEALDEYEARNFAEARALFLRAHALLPSARTLRGLGMAEFELKNYDDSVLRLEAALASPVRRLEGDLRRQTEELLVRARAFVGRFALQTVPAETEGLRLLLDGEPVTLGPERTLTVPVGEHVLIVQVPGYVDEKRTLSVNGAEDVRLVVELRQQSPERAPAAAFQPLPKKDTKPLWKNPWLWSGVGAVVLGGVVAGVVLSTNKGDNDSDADIAVQTLRRAR